MDRSKVPAGHHERVQEWLKKQTDRRILEALGLMVAVFMSGQSVYYLPPPIAGDKLEVFDFDASTFIAELLSRQRNLPPPATPVEEGSKTLQRFFQENQQKGLTFLPPTQ